MGGPSEGVIVILMVESTAFPDGDFDGTTVCVMMTGGPSEGLSVTMIVELITPGTPRVGTARKLSEV